MVLFVVFFCQWYLGLHDHGRFVEVLNFEMLCTAHIFLLPVRVIYLNRSELHKLLIINPRHFFLLFGRRPIVTSRHLECIEFGIEILAKIQPLNILGYSVHFDNFADIPERES
jgi:hypothetical protein